MGKCGGVGSGYVSEGGVEISHLNHEIGVVPVGAVGFAVQADGCVVYLAAGEDERLGRWRGVKEVLVAAFIARCEGELVYGIAEFRW